ncbi:hypothetical protein B0F90DRAFT_45164 [Multifurca ochricompacta]|uniref:Uncharacterized protein n=1 Tax=Multifurca ochricompacta TaxID=376703 RepID=A0AAD4QQ81_9AGAM|nr:hypothetical protein B0F90DRAFT_45164 [Multifurca ochricompacta]
MLPLPIFLLLILSATLLTPAPAVLIDLIRTVTLPLPTWDTLSVPIASSTLPPSPEETLLLPVFVPRTSLNNSLTYSTLTPKNLETNNSIPPPRMHTTDGRIISAAVSLVVVIAIVNCTVHKFLAQNPHKILANDVEKRPSQPTPSTFSPLTASLYKEFECYDTTGGMVSPVLTIDATIAVSGCDTPLDAHPSPSSIKFEQSSAFLNILSHGFSLGDSEETMNDDSSSAIQSMDLKALDTAPISPVVVIGDLELKLSQSTSLDTDRSKMASHLHLACRMLQSLRLRSTMANPRTAVRSH